MFCLSRKEHSSKAVNGVMVILIFKFTGRGNALLKVIQFMSFH